MISAIEANKNAKKINKLDNEKQLRCIEETIIRASNNGKFFAYFNYQLDEYCKNYLKNLGYTIEEEKDEIFRDIYTTIYWTSSSIRKESET